MQHTLTYAMINVLSKTDEQCGSVYGAERKQKSKEENKKTRR